MKPRKRLIALGVLLGVAASVSTAQATKPADWVPVDRDVWSVLMNAPQMHIMHAQIYLSQKDAGAAAAEIRRAGTFLKIQEKRLAAASQLLSNLANDVESGIVVSPRDVEVTANWAVSVLDYHQALIPVIADVDTLYADETDYHLAQAQSSLKYKDNKTAAADIRKAKAYLKLKAVHAGEKAKSELLASAAELNALARKMKAGGAAAGQDVEQAFERARKVVRRAL